MPCSDASSNLAILDRHVGNYQAALQDYAISLKCFGLYDNYENYVLMLYELHNLNQTEQYAKQGIQKYPQGVGLYYMLGVAEANKGDKTDALKNLNTAYQLYPAQKMENAINQVKNNEPATVQ